MAGQFIPVELAIIGQGQFQEECQKAFSQLAKDFVAFTEEHKVSAAATLNMSVKLNYDHKRKSFGIVTNIDPKMPKQPSGVTTAFVENDTVDGVPTLFTQRGGTGKGDPTQARLQEKDGKTVC